MIRIAWSGDTAPAASAAATSPTLWPITMAGSSPSAASARVSATCTANSSGCAVEVAASRGSSAGSCSASASDQPARAA
jgi:hypothetical protein